MFESYGTLGPWDIETLDFKNMRHLKAHRKLGRTTEHRMSMLRNLATSLDQCRERAHRHDRSESERTSSVRRKGDHACTQGTGLSRRRRKRTGSSSSPPGGRIFPRRQQHVQDRAEPFSRKKRRSQGSDRTYGRRRGRSAAFLTSSVRVTKTVTADTPASSSSAAGRRQRRNGGDRTGRQSAGNGGEGINLEGVDQR